MAIMRRRGRLVSVPANGESAARPVIVRVSTVVVRSGTASRRTEALRTPMATPSRPMTRNRRSVSASASSPMAANAASPTNAASVSRASHEPAVLRVADVDREPPAEDGAARESFPRETTGAATEKPGAPANANPRSTTLPVTNPVNTCPSPR